MLIPITLSSHSTSANPKLPTGLVKISHGEVVLVELQGSLDVDSNHPRERNGKFVGKLKIDEATSKPSLLIGNHLLEGKIQALPKPLAVLLRSASGPSNKTNPSNAHSRRSDSHDFTEGDDNENDDAMHVDPSPEVSRSTRTGSLGEGVVQENAVGEASSTAWTITAVVKKKIIFSKRPMPVMNKK